MANALNPDEALQRARELQEARLSVIDELANNNFALAQARDQATRAETDYSRSYSAAISAGWTTAELSRIGFAEAAKPPRVRRPARRSGGTDEGSSSE